MDTCLPGSLRCRFTWLIPFCLVAAGWGEEGTLHLIPDVNLVPQYCIDGGQTAFFTGNRTSGTFGRGDFDARVGINDLVNLDIGYAGGLTFGLTALALHEGSWYVPSIAIGFADVFNNSEAFLFKYDSAAWKSDCFVALGKSIPALGLRCSGGAELMPEVLREHPAGFLGIEKTIGGHASLSLETLYRDSRLQPSLFANAWLLGDRMELSVGAVDMNAMLLNSEGKIDLSFFAPERGGAVQPGIWIGLRFHGTMRNRGGNLGPAAMHASLDEQGKKINALQHERDSLQRSLVQSVRNGDSLRGSSVAARYRNGMLENLTMLATLYIQPNFEVSQVWSIKREITDAGDRAVPELQAIALDKSTSGGVHAQAVGLLGDIGSQNAADAVYEILSVTHDPETIIEGCIAAGKMHDHRAEALLEKFAGDKNESVAFTATTALEQLK